MEPQTVSERRYRPEPGSFSGHPIGRSALVTFPGGVLARCLDTERGETCVSQRTFGHTEAQAMNWKKPAIALLLVAASTGAGCGSVSSPLAPAQVAQSQTQQPPMPIVPVNDELPGSVPAPQHPGPSSHGDQQIPLGE